MILLINTKTLTVMTPVSPSIFQNQRKPASPCKRCTLLENENLKLKEQIEELRRNIGKNIFFSFYFIFFQQSTKYKNRVLIYYKPF